MGRLPAGMPPTLQPPPAAHSHAHRSTVRLCGCVCGRAQAEVAAEEQFACVAPASFGAFGNTDICVEPEADVQMLYVSF